MKQFLKTKFKNGLIFFLDAVGRVLNQNPTEEESKRVTHSPKMREPFWKKFYEAHPKLVKQKAPKKVYSYKGSGYMGKGNINTDAATFNAPRKGVSQGRRH